MAAEAPAPTAYKSESLKECLLRSISQMNLVRQPYIPLWRQLADNFLPFRGRWLNETPMQNLRRNSKIINETPLIAQRTFGAGMQAGLTSPSRPWFRLKPTVQALIEAEGVREWLYFVETEMRSMISRSNFYQSMRPCYSEYGVFGTMALGVFEDFENGIHCCPYTIGSYYVSINSKGRVDQFAQEFKWTVRQIVERWVRDPKNKDDPGWENISVNTRSAWDRNQRETFVDLVYIVTPNTDREYGNLDATGMQWVAFYFESANKSDERMLERAGFREFPIMCARLNTNEGDAYGTGLAVDCLGSAQSLQFHEKRHAQAVDKEIDPPMTAPTSLRNQPTSQLPGDVTFYDGATGGTGFAPAYEVKPDRRGTLETIAAVEGRINTCMFADIFALFIQGEDNPEETATKTAAKQQEKLMMLGPVVEGQNHEFNDPFIDRVFNIGLRQGRFPMPPEALQGQPLKVEYVSILSQAQNIVSVQGIERFTSYVLGVAGQQAAANVEPTALDKLDVDQAIDEYGNLSGVVPTILRSDDAVAQLREVRAQQQAQAQAAEQQMLALKEGSAAAKNLSQAKLGEDSALDAVAQTVQ